MGSLDNHSEDCHCKGCKCHLEICLEKSLSATLESFDNLFCRQCLVHAKNYPFNIFIIATSPKCIL